MGSELKRAATALVGGAVVAGIVGALWPSKASADSSDTPDERESVPEVSAELQQNERRLAINRGGMLTLLGWSAANIGVGSVGWATADGKWRYFHQMNVFWNVVNAAIGGLGYAQAVREGGDLCGHGCLFARMKPCTAARSLASVVTRSGRS